jgi:hypothetical protein
MRLAVPFQRRGRLGLLGHLANLVSHSLSLGVYVSCIRRESKKAKEAKDSTQWRDGYLVKPARAVSSWLACPWYGVVV